MNKQKMITTIKQEFMLKRIRAEEKAEENLNKLKQDDEFNSLYSTYTSTQLKYIKSKYEKENLELKNQVEKLKEKLSNLMLKQGMSFNDLSPKYDCKICKDTGVQIAYKKKQAENACLKLYRQTYQKKLMFAKRSGDENVKRKFTEWKLLAREKVKNFENKTISENELIEWLNKN